MFKINFIDKSLIYSWALFLILADIVMQDSVSLNKLSVTPLFYVRYVDDIALVIDCHDNAHIDKILIKFNSYHPTIYNGN